MTSDFDINDIIELSCFSLGAGFNGYVVEEEDHCIDVRNHFSLFCFVFSYQGQYWECIYERDPNEGLDRGSLVFREVEPSQEMVTHFRYKE